MLWRAPLIFCLMLSACTVRSEPISRQMSEEGLPEKKIEEVNGLFCDTSAQAVRVVRDLLNGMSIFEALKSVNKREEDVPVCVFLPDMALAEIRDQVAAIPSDGQVYTVVEVSIISWPSLKGPLVLVKGPVMLFMVRVWDAA